MRRAAPRGARPPASSTSVPIYLAMFVVLGMSLSFSGPALVHFRNRAHVGIGISGLLLAVQSGGYIVSSLVVGRFYDRGHGHRLLAGAAVVTTGAVVGLVWSSAFALQMVLLAVVGAAGAVIDVGGNTLVVWARTPETVGSTLNALHLCFGIGALATPLLVSRSIESQGDLRIFALVLGAAAVVLAVTLTFADEPVHRVTAQAESGRRPSLRGGLGLVCAFFILYVGLEAGFAGWVNTWAREVHLGDVGTAGVLTSVFWSGFTAGRLISIWIAHRVKPVALLVGSCALATVAVTLLAIGGSAQPWVWITTPLFGASIGPQFPTMIAFSDQRLHLSGAATSFLVASSGIGGLTLPLAIGWLFDRAGATAMPWTVAVAAAITTALVVAIVLGVGQRPPATSTNAPVT